MSEQEINHIPLRFAVYRSYRQSGEEEPVSIFPEQDNSQKNMPESTVSEYAGRQKSMESTVSEQDSSPKSMSVSTASERDGRRKSMSESTVSEEDDRPKIMSANTAPEQDSSLEGMLRSIASESGGIFTAEYIETDSSFRRFGQMLEDAGSGSFDCILADSVSSFGRNTKTALAAIERLRELGIGVVFQKENINTLEKSGQELLSVISAFAAKKSRNHSEAIRRALQENYASGKPGVNLNRMLGYDLSSDGETWVINEEQAKIVRFIFESYAAGVSANQIARNLNAQGARTVNGNIWRADTIMVVLRNEKYAGDLEMQKTVSTVDGGREKNTGQLPRHYETNHHAAIIERDLWDLVQAMLLGYGRDDSVKKDRHTRTVFGSLTCPYCGGSFKRYGYSMPVSNYTDERSLAAESITGEEAEYFSEQYAMSYSVWRCENKYRGHEGKHGRLSAEDLAACDTCPESPILYEIALEQSFMEMIYRMKREYQDKAEQASFAREFREAYKRVYETIGGTGAVARQIEALEDRIRTLSEQAEAVRAKMGEALSEGSVTGTKMEEVLSADVVSGRCAVEAGHKKDRDILKSQRPAGKTDDINDEEPAQECTENLLSGTKMDDMASVSGIYMKLIADIERSIAECEEEKKKLSEQLNATLTMKKNYDFFLRCLKALPEENKAGETLNIYVINCQKDDPVHFEGEIQKKTDGERSHHDGEIEENSYVKTSENKWKKNHDGIAYEDMLNMEEDIFNAPDFLAFDKSIYLTFFPRGEVRGDSIEYTTSFGVKVICSGCGRDLNSFLGFRQVNEKGDLEMITENWQVNRRQIQYRRKERKYRKHTS